MTNLPLTLTVRFGGMKEKLRQLIAASFTTPFFAKARYRLNASVYVGKSLVAHFPSDLRWMNNLHGVEGRAVDLIFGGVQKNAL
jgi:hypothetical protein